MRVRNRVHDDMADIVLVFSINARIGLFKISFRLDRYIMRCQSTSIGLLDVRRKSAVVLGKSAATGGFMKYL